MGKDAMKGTSLDAEYWMGHGSYTASIHREDTGLLQGRPGLHVCLVSNQYPRTSYGRPFELQHKTREEAFKEQP
jgi:hypothetical protein